MIDHELIADPLKNPVTNRNNVTLAIMFQTFENTPEFLALTMKHEDVRETYEQFTKICESKRTELAAKTKFESFMNMLTESEKQIILQLVGIK